MMSSSPRNLEFYGDEGLTFTLGGGESVSGEERVGKVAAMASHAARLCLRGGLFAAKKTFQIALVPGVRPTPVVVKGLGVGRAPPLAVPHARATAFRVKELADGDLIAALRAYDGTKPAPRGRKVPFYRSTHRLEDLDKKSRRMARPSCRISPYQIPEPFSFGGGPPAADRPLVGPVLASVRHAGRALAVPGYEERMREAVDLGDYTTHDPDTLHPRFLHYVHERITDVDASTNESMLAAVGVKNGVWNELGISVKARPLSDAEPQVLSKMVNSGSPGEYRVLGAVDRRDPRLIETMSHSLMRYHIVGKLIAVGKRAPTWVGTTAQPTLSFGKEEPKAAKIGKDGERIPPVPRFIFNMSPINYALAVFLHGDLSKQLQMKDPTHGPGFGPSRGRSGKFLDLVERCFGRGYQVPEGEEMVMSDIAKWDANMREVLQAYTYDMIENRVQKDGLSAEALATRAAMSSVSRRQLLRKLVEHPSGYLVDLFGCMPSGSYYTSYINTEANDLLLIGHIIDRVKSETEWTAAGAAVELIPLVQLYLVSYGDNQLFSAKLFKFFGLKYDPVKHAEYLSRFGMELKVDETEVTRSLGRVRFCSRGVVNTPHGLLITRSHTSLAAKLAGRPEHDPLTDKLYVRAMMADHLGTDPVTFDMLSRVDQSIQADLSTATIGPKVRPVIAAAAKSLLGSADDWALDTVLDSLTTYRIDRRAVLSLHTARLEGIKEQELGPGLTVGGSLFGGPLTLAAQYVMAMGPKEWGAFLRETGQEGVLYD
nr:RNA-dependent RNA polymerase [Metarhizium brunneum polymycovirus 1]